MVAVPSSVAVVPAVSPAFALNYAKQEVRNREVPVLTSSTPCVGASSIGAASRACERAIVVRRNYTHCALTVTRLGAARFATLCVATRARR